jgi:hypothetical protein
MGNPYQPISNLNSTAPNFGLLMNPALRNPVLQPGPDTNSSGSEEFTQAPSTGVKAKSPDQNLTAKPKTLPRSQTASVINSLLSGGGSSSSGGSVPTPPPAGNKTPPAGNPPVSPNNGSMGTGLYGQTQTPSYPGLVGALGSMSLYGSPQVDQATKNLQAFQQNYANLNAAIQGDPNYSLDTQQGKAQVLNTQYANQLGSYQQALQNALTQQSQQLGGIGSAAGLAAPHWNGYAGLNPFTNQPIGNGTPSGGGTSGGSNLNQIATWGAGIDYATQAATQGKNNDVSIATARSQGQNLLQLLSSTPGYNSNPVNVWNTVVQEIQGNVSNPVYPQIDASVKNVLSNYAQVLGVDPTTLLIQGAQAPSLGAFLTNLDNLATSKNTQLKNIGLGGGLPASPNYSSLQSPTTSTQNNSSQPTSFTRPNGQVVTLQPDGTYK